MTTQQAMPTKQSAGQGQAVTKPGKQHQEPPRRQRVFLVARSVRGHEVVNTIDLSPHFEFSF